MRRASLAVLTLAGVAVAAAAAAQQRRPFPPLPVPAATLEAAPLSFTLSQSLEANTNYDLVNDPAGTTYYGETRFALDYLRAADTSLLSLGIDTGLRGVEHPDDDFEWVAASPSSAYLDYRAEGVDTLFDLGLTARSRIVELDDHGDHRGRSGRSRHPRTPSTRSTGTRASTATTPTSASPAGRARRAPGACGSSPTPSTTTRPAAT